MIRYEEQDEGLGEYISHELALLRLRGLSAKVYLRMIGSHIHTQLANFYNPFGSDQRPHRTFPITNKYNHSTTTDSTDSSTMFALPTQFCVFLKIPSLFFHKALPLRSV